MSPSPGGDAGGGSPPTKPARLPTSSPFPRNAASSSMPSSVHTVLSTSKQNAVDLEIKSKTFAEGSLRMFECDVRVVA